MLVRTRINAMIDQWFCTSSNKIILLDTCCSIFNKINTRTWHIIHIEISISIFPQIYHVFLNTFVDQCKFLSKIFPEIAKKWKYERTTTKQKLEQPRFSTSRNNGNFQNRVNTWNVKLLALLFLFLLLFFPSIIVFRSIRWYKFFKSFLPLLI